MITTITLLFFFAVSTSAFHFESPIHVARPFEEVHTHCDKDVQIYCDTVDVKENQIETDVSRRLSDVQTKKITVSRTYSLSFGVSITPKKGLKVAQHAKDNTRFLNYGPATDRCLWNSFNKQRVSEQCATALRYMNDSENSGPYGYTDKNESYSEYTKIAISCSGFSMLMIILSYFLAKQLFFEKDGKDETSAIETRLEHDTYQRMDESSTIFVAVPVQVV